MEVARDAGLRVQYWRRRARSVGPALVSAIRARCTGARPVSAFLLAVRPPHWHQREKDRRKNLVALDFGRLMRRPASSGPTCVQHRKCGPERTPERRGPRTVAQPDVPVDRAAIDADSCRCGRPARPDRRTAVRRVRALSCSCRHCQIVVPVIPPSRTGRRNSGPGVVFQ